jgi:hypothetical protein
MSQIVQMEDVEDRNLPAAACAPRGGPATAVPGIKAMDWRLPLVPVAQRHPARAGTAAAAEAADPGITITGAAGEVEGAGFVAAWSLTF